MVAHGLHQPYVQVVNPCSYGLLLVASSKDLICNMISDILLQQASLTPLWIQHWVQ
jgi:hypothetical protein